MTWRVCQHTGKQCHASRADAAQSLRTAPSNGMHAYRCASCDSWHIGHGGDPPRRLAKPRLSGTPALRRLLGEAMARHDIQEARRIRDLMLNRLAPPVTDQIELDRQAHAGGPRILA